MAVSVALAAVGSLDAVHPLVSAAAMPPAAVGMGLLDPCVTVLSLKHSPPHRQGHTTSALQTTMNLGQVVVLGVASAVLQVGLASAPRLGRCTAAFALLAALPLLVAALSGRARSG